MEGQKRRKAALAEYEKITKSKWDKESWEKHFRKTITDLYDQKLWSKTQKYKTGMNVYRKK